ncbi:MAG: hypothetical protein ACFB0B_04850 [Thermonemataceae bacterium]
MRPNLFSLEKLTGFLFLTLFLYNCDSKPTDEDRVTTVDTTNLAQDTIDLATDIKKVAGNFPSPVDFVSHISQADIAYQKTLLNSATRADDYLTNTTQTALNLGVYLADLGYSSLYFKAQAALAYLKAIEKLSDQLEILNEQSIELAKRFEENLEERDSLLMITREAYFSMDEYLKESDRKEVSALILAGSWTEGLYLSCMAIQSNENIASDPSLQPILWRVGGQKRSLDNLISILTKQKEDEMVKDLLVQLKALQKVYEKVRIVEESNIDQQEVIDIAEVKDINDLTDQTVIRSIAKVEIEPATFEEITKKIKTIRATVIAQP